MISMRKGIITSLLRKYKLNVANYLEAELVSAAGVFSVIMLCKYLRKHRGVQLRITCHTKILTTSFYWSRIDVCLWARIANTPRIKLSLSPTR